MNAPWKVGAAAVALAMLSAGDAAGADAVTQCGSAQLKVLTKLYKGLYAEGTRACTAGSALNPQPIDVAKVTALVTANSAGMQATIDQFGDANCFLDASSDLAGFIALAQSVANALCLVP